MPPVFQTVFLSKGRSSPQLVTDANPKQNILAVMGLWLKSLIKAPALYQSKCQQLWQRS